MRNFVVFLECHKGVFVIQYKICCLWGVSEAKGMCCFVDIRSPSMQSVKRFSMTLDMGRKEKWQVGTVLY